MSRRIVLFALLTAVFSVSLAEAQPVPPVTLEISGSASPELLADFRQALRRMEQRRGQASINTPQAGPTEVVDLGQFWKAEQDISYTVDEVSSRQRLTLVYPFEGEPPYRTLVYFHDGDWTSGSPTAATDAAVFQAVYQGYAVASVGYRLADEATWPAQLHDAKAAIRYLRTHGGQYQVDTDRLVVWGRGAGGHIAQMLGATNDDPTAEDPETDYGDRSAAIQGIISQGGISDITDLPEVLRDSADALMGYPAYMSEAALEASPIAGVHPEFPPALLIHHTGDPTVPFEQSVRMAIRVNAGTGESKATLNLVADQPAADSQADTATLSRGLDFADAILYPGDGNPHRSSFFPAIQTTVTEP